MTINVKIDQKFETFILSGINDQPIVLHMPDINVSLTEKFGDTVETSHAPMVSLKKFGNPRRGVHRNFHDFKSGDWEDFENKLNRLKSEHKDNLYIACNNNVTAYGRLMLPKDPREREHYKAGLLKNLNEISSRGASAGKKGAGDAINAADACTGGLVIAFPRIEFNDLAECTIHLFSSKNLSTLDETCLHSPDQKNRGPYSDLQIEKFGLDS